MILCFAMLQITYKDEESGNLSVRYMEPITFKDQILWGWPNRGREYGVDNKNIIVKLTSVLYEMKGRRRLYKFPQLLDSKYSNFRK